MSKFLIPPSLLGYCLIVMIICCIALPNLNLLVFPYNLCGVVVVFVGFAIMGKARMLLKKHNTTLKIQQSQNIVTEGVFQKTRNPMYFGMAVLLFGAAILSSNVISLVVPLLFVFLVSLLVIPKEEKLMIQKFGQEYLDYTQKVHRWL